MFPRDAVAPPAISGLHDGGAGARRRSRLRGPAMLFPYVGIVVGAVVLARIPETYFEQFWWLAPAAAIVYLTGLSMTIGSLARRRRVAEHERESGAALEAMLVLALRLPESGRRVALEPLVPRLREVRIVSARLSPEERTALRASLARIDASAAIKSQFARTRRKWRRADALFTLGWLADEDSIPTLCDALNGPDPDLAYVAAQSLAEYDSAQACGCLLDALRRETLARPLAATLLEGSRFTGAPGLIADASGDRDPEVRSWIAYLIGRTDDARAGAWLSALAVDPDAKVRASAAESLAGFPDAATLGRLLTDHDWLVRANAARSVGRAGLSQLAGRLPPLLHDRAWWVRQSATLALKQIGAPSIAVVRPLLEDPDRFVRNKAAEVLVDLGYVTAQVAALAGTESDVTGATKSLTALARAEAKSSIEACAEVGDAATRERLRDLLEEVDAHR